MTTWHNIHAYTAYSHYRLTNCAQFSENTTQHGANALFDSNVIHPIRSFIFNTFSDITVLIANYLMIFFMFLYKLFIALILVTISFITICIINSIKQNKRLRILFMKLYNTHVRKLFNFFPYSCPMIRHFVCVLSYVCIWVRSFCHSLLRYAYVHELH